MDSACSEQQFRTIRETAMEKLQKGKEFAWQLLTLLKSSSSSGDRSGSVSGSAQELTLEISRSFTETISVLISSPEVNETGQIVAADGVAKVSSGDRTSKTSDCTRKKLGVKDRKVCHNRRRNISQSQIMDSPTAEDGHAWRKYGQKDILNSKFPRCYFRCTHKHDQDCKAIKQVQKIKEDPLRYRTTYFGHHTCQNTLMRAPQIIIDSDPMESSQFISFETKPLIKHDPVCLSGYALTTPTATTATGNQEFKDETQSDVSDNKSCLDSSPMLQDAMTNSASSGPKSSKIGGAANHEEVSSLRSCSSTPLHDLDMEDFSKFGDLDEDLCFGDMPGLL